MSPWIDRKRIRANIAAEQPWWIDATERPPEIDALERAFVNAGLCAWDARGRPHPQSYALVAWWALNGSAYEKNGGKGNA